MLENAEIFELNREYLPGWAARPHLLAALALKKGDMHFCLAMHPTEFAFVRVQVHVFVHA